MSKLDWNEQPTCCNCRFWDPIDDDGFGHCRRYAPRSMPEQLLTDRDGNVNRYVGFPMTDGGDWCGEMVEIAVPQ